MRHNKLIAIGRSAYLYDSLRYLLTKGFECKAIITEEAYEEYSVKAHDFEELAHSIGAAYYKTKQLPAETLRRLVEEEQIKVAISANWQYVIPENMLKLFEYGILNFHLGNLPDYKGNATVNWTMINGEAYINANIHKMDPVLDAGDIVAFRPIPILDDTYIQDILQQAEQMAPRLYEEALRRILAHPKAYEIKGSAHGLRCYPRLPEDSQIDWQQSPESISRLVRASSHPYQGAFSYLHDEKITIWKARPVRSVEKFLAIPGHVVAYNKESGSITVACRGGLLEVQEIAYRGNSMLPASFIRSIRLRFKYKA